MTAMLTTALDMGDDSEPIAALRRIREERHALLRREAEQVRRARAQGYSWQVISGALEISKQAAHKKYGKG